MPHVTKSTIPKGVKPFIIHQNTGKGKQKTNHMGTKSKVNRNQPHGSLTTKKEE